MLRTKKRIIKAGFGCSVLLALLFFFPASVSLAIPVSREPAQQPPPAPPATDQNPPPVGTPPPVDTGARPGAPPAPSSAPITDLPGLVDLLKRIVNALAPFIIGLAILSILWGIFGYITHSDEEEKRIESRLFIVWGIIGLFVMISIWGFVNLLSNTFTFSSLEPARPPALPDIPVS